MRIKSFKFDDHRTGWHLEETKFDAFNLLVGVSGVGKTKILEALRRVCRIATEGAYNPGQVEWAIEFEQEGKAYRWEGRTETVKTPGLLGSSFSSDSSEPPAEVQHEKVIVDNDTALIDRNSVRFLFDGTTIPMLNKSASSIFLLKGDSKILSINEAFDEILFSEVTKLPSLSSTPEQVANINGSIKSFQATANIQASSEFFRSAAVLGIFSLLYHTIPFTAYFLQESFPDEFKRVEALFIEIFPTVQGVRVSWSNTSGKDQRPSLEFNIREVDADAWIPQAEISSGMLRTLIHLFEIYCAPPGSVIIIDEFENSLGVKCMPQLTDFIMSRAPELQFILTSHHPYVINKIPTETWKLVTRKGGHVRVTSARDIPALQGTSHQKAFLRLINLPEFEQGIS